MIKFLIAFVANLAALFLALLYFNYLWYNTSVYPYQYVAPSEQPIKCHLPVIATMAAAWVMACVAYGITVKVGIDVVPDVYDTTYTAVPSVGRIYTIYTNAEQRRACCFCYTTIIVVYLIISTIVGIDILYKPYCQSEFATCHGQCVINNTSIVSQCVGLVNYEYCDDGTSYNDTYSAIISSGCRYTDPVVINILACGLTYKLCEYNTVVPYICPMTCANLPTAGGCIDFECFYCRACNSLHIFGTNKAC